MLQSFCLCFDSPTSSTRVEVGTGDVQLNQQSLPWFEIVGAPAHQELSFFSVRAVVCDQSYNGGDGGVCGKSHG